VLGGGLVFVSGLGVLDFLFYFLFYFVSIVAY
jgi:hypothetical protein